MSYENAARQQLHRRWWLRAVGVMACIVVFITVYALVLPAITMEGNPTCGLAEHEHTEDCYTADGVLICQLEEHTHDAACYAEAEEGELAEPDAEAEDDDLVAPPVDAEEVEDLVDDAEADDVQVISAVMPAPRLFNAGGTDASLMEGVTTTGANDWQIVSGGYEGNAASNKTLSADGNVRVQKNVIPTDTENEFLVYLSIDTRDEKVVTETEFTNYFYEDASRYLFYSSANYGSGSTGNYATGGGSQKGFTPMENPQSNKAVVLIVKHGDDELAVIKGEVDDAMWNIVFDLGPEFPTSPTNQRYIGLGRAKEMNKDRQVVVNLTDDIYEKLVEKVKESSVVENNVRIHSVTDVMGAHITDFSFVAGDGSASVGADGKTITWNITPKSNPKQETTTDSTSGDSSSTETTTTWNLNVAELIYRVKLDVTADGFVSGANEDVNQSATLNYAYSGDDRTDDFPVPVVKGLLYDIMGSKLDVTTSTSKPMGGVEFTVTGPDGFSKTVTTNDEGKFSVIGLPWGTYSVKETGTLNGYDIDDHTATVNLCYTQEKDNDTLVASTADDTHMMAKEQSGFEFKDKFIQPTIVLMKCDEGTNPLSGAGFTISGPVGGGSFTSDDDGMITTIANAENGEYTVTETQAPDGYNLLSDALTITVDGTNVTAKLGSAAVSDGDLTTAVDDETGITTVTIVLHNNSGVELPATGGPGTVIFTVSGLALMAAAMILLNKQRKRNHA